METIAETPGLGRRSVELIAPPGMASLVGLAPYEAGAREAVLGLKRRRDTELIDWVVERWIATLPPDVGGVTWVPTTPGRRRRRRFDQGEELGRALARRTGLPAHRLLRRTATSEGATRSGRRRADFTLFEEPPVGRSLVLVDDVSTTGASLRQAAAMLRLAGSGPVHARVIAIRFWSR